MAEGLGSGGQIDYSAGIFRSVSRDLIPANGVYDAVNALLDEDGVLYRRGGAEWGTNAAVDTSTTAVWDGYLAAGRRTLYATPTQFVTLADDDETPVALGGSGLAVPKTMAAVGGILFIGGGTMWAGSRKAAAYSTGTVAVTNLSKTLTGTGTSWLANVDPGMLIRVAGAGRYYVVASVDSDTQITLNDPYEGVTGSGDVYAATVFGTAAAHGARTSDIYLAAANRLFSLEGDHVYFSNGISPTGVIRTHVFDATDYHVIADGARCVAGAELGGTVLVFTTAGMWRITNVAYNLVDTDGNVQQQLNKVTSDLIAWGATGIATWQNAVAVAAVDGVYLVDGVSAPVSLTQSIQPVIVAYAQGGQAPGQVQVFRNHLWLPVLTQAGAVAALWTCRLDSMSETRVGNVYPWTRHDALAGAAGALAVRAIEGEQRLPELIASCTTVGRLLRLTNVFNPSADVKAEADGLVHGWAVETRDLVVGGEGAALVRWMRATLRIVADAGDDPRVVVYASVGRLQPGVTVWGGFDWGQADWSDATLAEFMQLAGSAPASDGRDPYTWPMINLHTRAIRYRFQSSDPAASMVLRSFEHFIRQSGSIT